MSLLGLACVVLIFLSMLLVNAAGEPMPPMPPSANRTPTACQPAPGFPPHGNLSGVEHSGGVGGTQGGGAHGWGFVVVAHPPRLWFFQLAPHPPSCGPKCRLLADEHGRPSQSLKAAAACGVFGSRTGAVRSRAFPGIPLAGRATRRSGRDGEQLRTTGLLGLRLGDPPRRHLHAALPSRTWHVAGAAVGCLRQRRGSARSQRTAAARCGESMSPLANTGISMAATMAAMVLYSA